MTLPTKTEKLLPIIFAVASFIGGFYLNYLSYTNKVDNLTESVSGLTKTIDKLTEKLESQDDRYNSIDKRLSKVEFYLFQEKPEESKP